MPRPGETVLVVDDEPTVRMLIADVLDGPRLRRIETEDGAAGLKVLRSEARVDLLVTDMILPGGMNGRQLAEAARAVPARRPGCCSSPATRRTPFRQWTAGARHAGRDQAIRAGRPGQADQGPAGSHLRMRTAPSSC